MNHSFLQEDFLLQNAAAKTLYHDYAEKMPIYDYHCHVSPKEIWEDQKYENLTQAWLYGDHYKWRLMRAMGMDESLITGGAGDYERFCAFAETVPCCIGNPMYHWVHLELKRFFGISEELNPTTAPQIWEKTKQALQNGLTARKMIEMSNVALVCTTDDPSDSLEYHRKLAADGSFQTRVLPAFRPDKVLSPTPEYLEKLGAAAGVEICSCETLLQALGSRMDWFQKNGCRLSDHSFACIPWRPASEEAVEQDFAGVLKGKTLAGEALERYQTWLMLWLGREYARRGWTMQLHLNALRNNSTRRFEQLGPDTGFDSINDRLLAPNLSAYLNALDRTEQLPKTIFYSLNPKDTMMLAAMAGNFQSGVPGKMQVGSAWWFNDQRDGMEEQLKTVANVGLLSKFIGMLTDSRSFLSYTRHEYFRRILCNLIGTWVENGEYPGDMERLGAMVQDICYRNAVNYFRM
ncbi:MAG: glucuronate isomerase [Firmicutes bacterium]|nr:glucuronate isomerase [Bacillota bacterium]